MLRISLIDSNSTIQREILKALVNEANDYYSQISLKIKNAVDPIIYDAVYNSPEMGSVRSGYLRLDFGITFDPTIDIAGAVAESVEVTFNQFKLIGNDISNGISINIQPTNYLNILNLPTSVVLTEKGASLPWLAWLTLYGNQIIIVNFGVEYKSGAGRTGGAHMVGSERPFKVNSSFAGTMEDNFVSRSIESALPRIQQVIENLL